MTAKAVQSLFSKTNDPGHGFYHSRDRLYHSLYRNCLYLSDKWSMT